MPRDGATDMTWESRDSFGTAEDAVQAAPPLRIGIPVTAVLDNAVAAAITAITLAPLIRGLFGVGAVAYLIPLAVLSGVAFLRQVTTGIRLPPSVVAFVVLSWLWACWMLTSFWWTQSRVQSITDVVLLVSIMLLVAVAAAAVTPGAAQRALTWIIFASVGMALYVSAQYWMVGSLLGYGMPLNENYLSVAQLIGIGLVAAVARGVFSARGGWWLPVAMILFVGLALSLARGALLWAIGISVGTALMGLRRGTWRMVPAGRTWGRVGRITRVLVVLLFVGGGFYGAFQVERTAAGLQRLISGSEWEIGGRGARLTAAWNNIVQAPWTGYGLGMSGIKSDSTEQDYPHNLFVQAWVDGGILAMVLLVLVVMWPFGVLLLGPGTSLRRAPPGSWLPFACIVAFLCLEHSKSTSIYSARTLFMFSTITLLVAASPARSGGGAPPNGAAGGMVTPAPGRPIHPGKEQGDRVR